MNHMNEMDKRTQEVIHLLRGMFGDGFDFIYSDCYQTNETFKGISMKLSDSSAVMPTVCLDDIPADASPAEIANMAAVIFQNALQELKIDRQFFTHMTRESILENVVLQALGRERNRSLLSAHPHFDCLDLAGVFRVPVGAYSAGSLQTVLISNQTAEQFSLSVDELTDAARKNTINKFGVELLSSSDLLDIFFHGRRHTAVSFEQTAMTEPGLYTLTNKIRINGAALMLIPEILAQTAQKAGMDFFIIPSSIHDVLIAKDDGSVLIQQLKKTIAENNRKCILVRPEDVLSDSLYFFNHNNLSLSFA